MIPVRTLQLLVSGGVIKAKTPGAITPKGDTAKRNGALVVALCTSERDPCTFRSDQALEDLRIISRVIGSLGMFNDVDQTP